MARKSQTAQDHYPRIHGAYRSQWLAIDYALRIVRKRLDAYYAEHDVDIRHIWVLLEARDTKETQGQIAEALGINLNVMVRVVDDMEKKGLVARKRNPKNRRESFLEPTGRGHELMDWWTRVYDKLAADAFRPVPLFQVNNARSWAMKIIDHYRTHGR
jgi:DNA-binding MarR family transcriptional regulator